MVSKALAEIDVSSSLAFFARENGYVRPEMSNEYLRINSRIVHEVQGGRHPGINISFI